MDYKNIINMIRKKDKLEKYIENYLNPTNVITSTRSQYYYFGSVIVRISDHLSFSPEKFTLTIVLNQNYPGYYIIYTCENTMLYTATYEEIKEIMKSIKLLSNLKGVLYKTLKSKDTKINNSILGIDKKYFTAGRLQIIEALVKKTRKDLKTQHAPG